MRQDGSAEREADGGGPGLGGCREPPMGSSAADFGWEAVENARNEKEYVCETARLVEAALQRGDADQACALLPCLGFMSES